MHYIGTMTDAKTISETCAMQALRGAARQATRLYERALAPVGLTASQFTTLVALWRLGEAGPSALAEVILADRTTMPRLLAPLERRGLVEGRPSDEDRRLRLMALTSEGRALLEEAVPLWEAAQAEAAATLGKEWAALAERLSRIGG